MAELFRLVKYDNLPRFMLTMVISPCVSHPLDKIPLEKTQTQFLGGGEEVPVDLATGNTNRWSYQPDTLW